MDCKKTQRYLSEYIDAVLDAPAQMAVENHLSQCTACRAELASLKAVVEELKSIQPVMAPDNFLADLHTRMEQTSPLKKLFQMLFVPFRIKLPLELATAAVLMVFISFIVQSPDVKKEWDLAEYQAEPSIAESAAPAETIAEEISRPAQSALEPKDTPVQEARKPVASRAQKMPSTEAKPSKAKETQSKLAKKERSYDAEPAMPRTTQFSATGKISPPLELVLFIPVQKPNSRAYSIRSRLASPLEKKDSGIAPDTEALQRSQEGRTTEGVIGGGVSQPMDEFTENDFAPAHVTSRVKKIVRRLQGKMVSVQDGKQTQQPQFLIAEIPARHYHTFLKDLRTIGTLRSPQPDITAKKAETVRIRIRLMPL